MALKAQSHLVTIWAATAEGLRRPPGGDDTHIARSGVPLCVLLAPMQRLDDCAVVWQPQMVGFCALPLTPFIPCILDTPKLVPPPPPVRRCGHPSSTL